MRYNGLLILAISLGLAACGGGAANNSNVAAVEPAAAASPALNIAEVTDPNVALAEGNRLMDENLTEAAIAAYQRAIELNPDLGEAHFKLGVAYSLLEMQNEQSGVATPSTENSNSKTPKKTESEKAFEAAVKAYEKWLDDNPKDDVAHYYLGRTYAKLMKDEEAEEAFQEAVKLKPDDTEYQTELGAILVKLAQYHEALKPLKKAIELDGANGRAIELLEDAEAGRRRVDYVTANKNGNTAAGPKTSNTNSAANSNSASSGNTAPPANTSKKPEPDPRTKPTPRDARPRTVSNRPA